MFNYFVIYLEIWRLCLVHSEPHENSKLEVIGKRLSVIENRNSHQVCTWISLIVTIVAMEHNHQNSKHKLISLAIPILLEGFAYECDTHRVTSRALWTLACTEPRRSAPIFFRSCVSRTNNQSCRSSLWTWMKSTSVSRNILNTWTYKHSLGHTQWLSQLNSSHASCTHMHTGTPVITG